MKKVSKKVSKAEEESIALYKKRGEMLRLFCRLISEIPPAIVFHKNTWTEKKKDEILGPIGTAVFGFAVENNLDVSDLPYIDFAMKNMLDHTVTRAVNLSESLVQIILMDTFGTPNLSSGISLKKLMELSQNTKIAQSKK